MHTIQDQNIIDTLADLHRQSSKEFPIILKGLAKGVFRKLKPEDMKDAYIAISPKQGAFLYDLLVSKQAKNIIEFGASFGISTLYLGAAAKTNNGKVITTELLPEKCRVANSNFAQAELDEYIELREGNALVTLQDVPDGIDFLLLDGWNDLYLPLLRLLEPKFKHGTLIYTDNASFRSAKPFLAYLQAHPEKYQTERLQDDKGGSELSMYIGKTEAIPV